MISAGILALAITVAGFFIWQGMKKEVQKHQQNELVPVYEKPEDALNFPIRDADSEVLQKHTQLVLESAVQTNTIEIKDCKPSPLIADVFHGSNVTFQNTGDIDITLYWPREVEGGTTEFTIPANGENYISIDFLEREEIGDLSMVSYSCDPSFKPAGILVIQQSPSLP